MKVDDYGCTRALSRALIEQGPEHLDLDEPLPYLEQAMRDDVIKHCAEHGWRVVTTPRIVARRRRRWLSLPGDERLVDPTPGNNWDHELWVIMAHVTPLEGE